VSVEPQDLETLAFHAWLVPPPEMSPIYGIMRAAFLHAMRFRAGDVDLRKIGGRHRRSAEAVADDAMRAARIICDRSWPAGREDFRACLIASIELARTKHASRFDVHYRYENEWPYRSDALVERHVRAAMASCHYALGGRMLHVNAGASDYRRRPYVKVSRDRIALGIHNAWCSDVWKRGLSIVGDYAVLAATSNGYPDEFNVSYFFTRSNGYVFTAAIREGRVVRENGQWILKKRRHRQKERPMG